MDQMIRVGILCSSEVLRTGLHMLLRDLEVVDLCGNDVRSADLDIVLYEITVQHEDTSLGQLERLAGCGSPVVLLSWSGCVDYVGARAGAAATISVHLPLDVIRQRVLEAAKSGSARRVTNRGVAPLPNDLSAREVEVLQLVAAGYTNQQIGELLHLSVNTVKTYIRTGYGKIGVVRRSQAVGWVMRNGPVVRNTEPTTTANPR